MKAPEPEAVTVQSALDLIQIAAVYLEDGAPATALARAKDAVLHLEILAARRQAMIDRLVYPSGAA